MKFRAALSQFFHRAVEPAPLPVEITSHPSFSFGQRVGDFYREFSRGITARELEARSDPLFFELDLLEKSGSFDFTAFNAGFAQVVKGPYTKETDLLLLKEKFPEQWAAPQPQPPAPKRFFDWR